MNSKTDILKGTPGLSTVTPTIKPRENHYTILREGVSFRERRSYSAEALGIEGKPGKKVNAIQLTPPTPKGEKSHLNKCVEIFGGTLKTGLLSMLILLISFFKSDAQEAISIFGRVYADPNNGPGYFEPLSNVLNTGMSMHWQSHRPQSRLRLGLSVIAARSFIPESYKSFEASYTTLENGQTLALTAPTVFGVNEALIVTEANGYSHVFPGGFDYDFVTIAVPQLTVEGLLNSAVSLRFITFNIDDEVGKFTTFGLSVEHHFAQYFDLESTILSASVGYEDIEAGNIMDARHSFFQFTGGGFGEVFHYYGSLGMQLFSQSVRYEDPFKGFAVQEIDIPATNRFLLKLGAGFQWSIISAGVEISPLAPFSVGVQLGLKI